jgi:TM2 domain-containing membrane protein YozV
MFKSETQIQPGDPPKDPIIAALLSFLIAGGLGQIYFGQTKKGLIIIAVSVIFSTFAIG